MKNSLSARLVKLRLVEDSPLRRLDPRTKICLGLCASLMVMLPLARLVVFHPVLPAVPGLGAPATGHCQADLAAQMDPAGVIRSGCAADQPGAGGHGDARIAMLAGVFTLLFATTTPAEFTLALENLGLPYRYAFSLGLAFQSLTLLEEEWNGILEAQRSRGALRPFGNWRDSLRQVSDLVALTVPAVVMTTKRAWSITEAAYARGFDSPRRTSYRRLQLTRLDYFGDGGGAADQPGFPVLAGDLLFFGADYMSRNIRIMIALVAILVIAGWY